MRSSIIFQLIGLASNVLAASINPLVERQSVTSLQVVTNEVNVASAAVQADVNAINAVVKTTGSNVNAQAQLIATVTADYGAIAAQLIASGDVIADSTVGLVTGLTAPEIDALTATVRVAASLAATLSVNTQGTLNSLVAATRVAVRAEAKAAIAALSPFSTPLIAYAQAVAGIATNAGVGDVTGLVTATADLNTTVSAALGSFGISL